MLGEFLQRHSYHICKAGGVGTAQIEKKKGLQQVVGGQCVIGIKYAAMVHIGLRRKSQAKGLFVTRYE